MIMSNDRVHRIREGLTAEADEARLAIARELALGEGEIDAEVEQTVREAFAQETVPWVRGALAEVLARIEDIAWEEGLTVPAPAWDVDLEGVEHESGRELINRSTRRVLHEVSAVVGRARVAARTDLGEAYSSSETGRQLEYLSEVCAGLRTLSAATQAPKQIEFDLASELGELAHAISEEFVFPIRVNGPAPFIVKSDRGLLRVALRNILVNAIEATQTLGAADGRAVMLTWGVSADALHITVIDRGPGPPPFLAALKQAGVTTKEGHPGYGLATASEAMRSIGGRVQIRRNDRGGATVVLSWADN
jgi:signal transduction histidine kinase